MGLIVPFGGGGSIDTEIGVDISSKIDTTVINDKISVERAKMNRYGRITEINAYFSVNSTITLSDSFKIIFSISDSTGKLAPVQKDSTLRTYSGSVVIHAGRGTNAAPKFLTIGSPSIGGSSYTLFSALLDFSLGQEERTVESANDSYIEYSAIFINSYEG